MAVSVSGLLLCLVRPFRADNTRILGRLLHWGVMPLAGLKVKIFGKEKLKNLNGPMLFISNHQDNFDAFIIGGFVPKDTVSVGKKVIKYFPFFGQIYWLSGNILIDRKRKKRAMGTMNQAAEQMKEKGINVYVMPEGTRSRGQGLLPFKKGVFHLAIQTGYPIVPISISNYAKILNLNSLKGTPVYVKVMEQIKVTQEDIPSKENINALVEKAFNSLKSGIDEMDSQIVKDNEISP